MMTKNFKQNKTVNENYIFIQDGLLANTLFEYNSQIPLNVITLLV